MLCYSNSAESFAAARNVEDLAAAKITPMIPAEIAAQLSRQTFTSKITSKIASSLASAMVSLIPDHNFKHKFYMCHKQCTDFSPVLKVKVIRNQSC